MNEVITKAKIIEETSNSIFELINGSEQQYLNDRYKITIATDVSSILDKNQRMELMVNYDIKDIALIKNGRFIVYPRGKSADDLLLVKRDTAFIRNNDLFIADKNDNWIKIFIYDMKSVAAGNDSLNFGAFLRKIRDKTNTIYFIWQDFGGIIAATGNISRISSINSDAFLTDALRSGDYRYRFITFEGKKGIEIVKCINKQKNQLLRICFNAMPLYAAIKKVFFMFIVSSILILLIGVSIFILLYNKRTIEKMTQENLFNREIIKNVFDGIESPVVIFDGNGRIILKNRYFGEIEDELKRIHSLNSLNDETVEINERLYSVFLSNIDVENMAEMYKLAILIDRTDKIHLEEVGNERKRQKENEEFIAEFAHQVKNPLNAISMAAQRLLSGRKFDEEIVGIIYEEISQLNKRIGKFLEKIRESRTDKICINEVLSDICKLYGIETEEKNIRLSCAIPEERYDLRIKKIDITNIMNNLIKNAIESFENEQKEGKYIKISFVRKESNIIIAVEDNGKDITKESAEKLFQKGYSEKSSGTGLGLYVVKKTVEKYDGKIDLILPDSERKIFQVIFKYR
ncbi:MAG: GHKL domain-containing protein [Proteobacteria bacterium]|nr:GHKL domain-containing protein [Pseudomonadota bacterium]